MLKNDLKITFDFLLCRVFQSQLPENGAPLLPPRALTSQSLPELFHDHVIEQVSNSLLDELHIVPKVKRAHKAKSKSLYMPNTSRVKLIGIFILNDAA